VNFGEGRRSEDEGDKKIDMDFLFDSIRERRREGEGELQWKPIKRGDEREVEWMII